MHEHDSFFDPQKDARRQEKMEEAESKEREGKKAGSLLFHSVVFQGAMRQL